MLLVPPLSLNKATEQRRRVHFARVCIEISCGDELPDLILVDINEIGQIKVSVEYAWKPTMCSLCKSLGHVTQTCRVSKEWKPKSSSSLPKESDGFSVPQSEDAKNYVMRSGNTSKVESSSVTSHDATVGPSKVESSSAAPYDVIVGSSNVRSSSKAPHDAAAEGPAPKCVDPSISLEKSKVPKDVSTEGTPLPQASPAIVPDDVATEGAVHGSVPSKSSGAYNNKHKNVYTVPIKLVFIPVFKFSSPDLHNSFSVLEKEVEPSKNKSFL